METALMDATKIIWTPIPGYESYDVSTDGQVRSWKRRGNTKRRADEPRILKPVRWKTETYYWLGAKHVPLETILAMAGVYCPVMDRELTAFELSEIRDLLGIKTVYDVADEFGITAIRVGNIWDQV